MRFSHFAFCSPRVKSSFSNSPVEGELAETGHHPDPGGGCLHLHQ